MRSLIPTEAQDQRALFKWASYTKAPNGKILVDYMLHPKNEGAKDPIAGRMHRLGGLKAGVSDIFLAYPMQPYWCGLWIELKRSNLDFRSVTKMQDAWLSRMCNIGYAACICYGLDAAIERILNYLGLTVDGK